MFDIGWTELLLIGVIALIVVGPKDLPGMFRTLGRFTAKMRSMAREFQRTMEQAADESGVKEVSRDLRQAASVKNLGLNPIQESAKKFKGGWKSGLDILDTEDPRLAEAANPDTGAEPASTSDSKDAGGTSPEPAEERAADLADSTSEPEAPSEEPADRSENAEPVKAKAAVPSEAAE